MSSSIDLGKYWGVQLHRLHFDPLHMSVVMDLYWTIDSSMHSAKLAFRGITRCEMKAEKVYESEVVELISLEAKRLGKFWQVIGELSNYEFEIVCVDVEEQD